MSKEEAREDLTCVSTLWKVTEAKCSEKEKKWLDFQHWETKNKAIGWENWGTFGGRASFILKPRFCVVPARNAPASK